MNLKHKVRINVTDEVGNKQEVLQGGVRQLPRWFARWLFGKGNTNKILVLTPGETIESVEIHEVNKKGA